MKPYTAKSEYKCISVCHPFDYFIASGKAEVFNFIWYPFDQISEKYFHASHFQKCKYCLHDVSLCSFRWHCMLNSIKYSMTQTLHRNSGKLGPNSKTEMMFDDKSNNIVYNSHPINLDHLPTTQRIQAQRKKKLLVIMKQNLDIKT